MSGRSFPWQEMSVARQSEFIARLQEKEIDGTFFLSEFKFSLTHCFVTWLAADVTRERDVFFFKGKWLGGCNCCETAVLQHSAVSGWFYICLFLLTSFFTYSFLNFCLFTDLFVYLFFYLFFLLICLFIYFSLFNNLFILY
jgi:hypothetical protein